MASESSGETLLTLNEVAERRGVHYMTVYRHVRTGKLPATKSNGEWKVRESDLSDEAPTRTTTRTTDLAARQDAFADRLLVGDEPGAWTIVENALAGGASAVDVHHRLLIPVLGSIGSRWESGSIGVVDEHTATAVAYRIVARLGPQMRTKGRNRGTIVVGAVAGDTHSLATSILADLLRTAKYAVVDLGGNTPAESFVETVARVDRCRAVGLSASGPADETIRRTVAAINTAAGSIPILIGGRGIRNAEHAMELGSAGFADGSMDLVPLFERVIEGGVDRNDPSEDGTVTT